EMSGRRPSDWLLAEANYLVNMAGRKLYLEKDIRTAMTLLKEADTRLNDLNDPSLFPVRALIAGDIQALSLVNPVSTNSIALAIAGMLSTVSELPLDTLQLPENINQQDLTLSENISDWRQNLQKTWQSVVDDLISIDYVDQPLEPYLAQRQQWLIEQQLNYALTQAQTAALNEQVEFYRAATQRAIGLLVEHYQIDNVRVSQFLGALQELQNIDFSRNYPANLASQASLQGIIEKRIQGLYNNSNTLTDSDENLDNAL
ncbi:MAG: uroporphyrin-3 C-methyltransferase, partial [Patiriisocius sp.]